MSETVMYKNTSRERKHLGFVLHAAEWRRENKSVVVALEFSAIVMPLGVMVFLTESLVGYKLLPVHILIFCAKLLVFLLKTSILS